MFTLIKIKKVKAKYNKLFYHTFVYVINWDFTNEKLTLKVTKKENVNMQKLFKQFIDECRNIDPSKEMNRVLLKLEKDYNNASVELTKSEHFENLLRNKIDQLPTTPYLQIKDILDELKYNQKTESDNKNTPKSKKREIQRIAKLENLLEKLSRKIKKLEQREVTSDEEGEENAYLKESRYKRRFCEVYKLLCKLQNKPNHAGRFYLKKVKYSGSTFSCINRSITKLYNKKRIFPDFYDVWKTIEKVNVRKDLKLTAEEVNQIAHRIFQEFGQQLQRSRRYDMYELINYYSSSDPTAEDEDLQFKLEQNKNKYKNKESEILHKYATLQKDLGPGNSGKEEEEEENDDDDNDEENDDKLEELSESIIIDGNLPFGDTLCSSSDESVNKSSGSSRRSSVKKNSTR